MQHGIGLMQHGIGLMQHDGIGLMQHGVQHGMRSCSLWCCTLDDSQGRSWPPFKGGGGGGYGFSTERKARDIMDF